MRTGNLFVAAALAAMLAAPAPVMAQANDVKAAARLAAAKVGKAVVTVKLVVKIKLGGARGGREQEQKLEVVGTVIDPSGLTVVSALAVEPTAGMGGRRGRDGGEAPRIESEVSETAIILDDGTEIEADVVLKDADLDLAFIRPRGEHKLDAVELKPRGKAPELLEDVFAITRLGRGDARATAAAVGTVRAVVKGPRTYYICSPEVATPGCVAYGADGAPLGVFVVKTDPDERGGGRFGGARGASVILRPVEDVLEVAKQAKEAKAPEPKPATPPAAPLTEEKKEEQGAAEPH